MSPKKVSLVEYACQIWSLCSMVQMLRPRLQLTPHTARLKKNNKKKERFPFLGHKHIYLTVRNHLDSYFQKMQLRIEHHQYNRTQHGEKFQLFHDINSSIPQLPRKTIIPHSCCSCFPSLIDFHVTNRLHWRMLLSLNLCPTAIFSIHIHRNRISWGVK